MTNENLLTSKNAKAKLDYLKELLTDRHILCNYPGLYTHVGKILENEIITVRSSLFSTYGIYTISNSDLPEPEGQKVTLQTKVFMPVEPSNTFNFVGRLLGPDGSTAKCLQQCLGVKIMIRGRGSMRDRRREEANAGKPNWEHLNEDLHVVLSVEDTENRAQARLTKASEYITLFLNECMKGPDREDKVKQMQLMELSFRKESRATWNTSYNNLMDFTLGSKHNTLLPNPNLMNLGIGYPFFSHLHHHGPHPQHFTRHPNFEPVHHHQQQQQSITVPQGHPYQSPLSPNLGAAMFLGHGPHGGPYHTGPFSPQSQQMTQTPQNSHGPTATQLQAQMAMNYWSVNGAGNQLTNLSPEYALQASYMQHHSSPNGTVYVVSGPENISPGENNGSNNQPIVSSVSMPCSSQSAMSQVFLPSAAHQNLQRIQDENLQQTGIIQDYHQLNPNVPAGSKEMTESHTSSSINPLLPGLFVSLPNNQQHNSMQQLTGNSQRTTPSKQNGKQRYSHKQLNQFSNAQTSVNHQSATSRNASRPAMVTVKVNSNERVPKGQHKQLKVSRSSPSALDTTLASSAASTGLSNESNRKEGETPSNLMQEVDAAGPKLVNSKRQFSPLLPLGTSELDWPQLSSAGGAAKMMSSPKQQVAPNSPVAEMDHELLTLSEDIGDLSVESADTELIIVSPISKSGDKQSLHGNLTNDN